MRPVRAAHRERDGQTVATTRGPRVRLLAVAALALLAGCATAPEPGPTIPESLLLPGYSTWFTVDVGGNRELLQYVLDELDSELAEVVDRVSRITGGLRILPGVPAELSAVASGALPRGGVEFVLSTGGSFDRESAEVDGATRSYFRRQTGTLQLALPRDDYLYVSTGRVLEMLQSRPPAELWMQPDVYRALRSVGSPYGPDLLVVFDDPGAGLLGALGVEAGMLPLARIDLSLSRPGPASEESSAAGAAVELGGEVHLRSERDARLFGRVGRLFVVLFVRALGLDSRAVQEQAEITVDGARVVFSGIPMTRDELVAAIERVAGGAQ